MQQGKNRTGKILVSACLVGIECRYDGKGAVNENVLRFLYGADFVPVCPEQLGGLATPREPAEIDCGDGYDVLKGKSRIVSNVGSDVTKNYLKGAEEAVKIAEMTGCKTALLKEKSPSCGTSVIYDGSFSGVLKQGCGAFCAMLRERGVEVIGECSLSHEDELYGS